MDDFDEISKQILEEKKAKGIPEVLIQNVNGLFLDASSTCTGYTVVNFDISDKKAKAKITKAGVLWFDDNWQHGEKYSYLYNAILNYFDITEQIDLIVYEQYSINKDRMSGSLVLPELIGCVKLAGQECGIKVSSLPPQSWRAQVGIKPVTKLINGKNKRDYKTPCIDKMKTLFKNFPEQSISNITKKNRATPSDLADSLGVAIGWLYKNGYKNVDFSKCEFNSHIGVPGV